MITKTKKEELIQRLSKISVSARIKKIFESKYGLKDGVWKSNAIVGKKFKISGEAVRLNLLKVEKLMNEG